MDNSATERVCFFELTPRRQLCKFLNCATRTCFGFSANVTKIQCFLPNSSCVQMPFFRSHNLVAIFCKLQTRFLAKPFMLAHGSVLRLSPIQTRTFARKTNFKSPWETFESALRKKSSSFEKVKGLTGDANILELIKSYGITQMDEIAEILTE